MKGFNVYISEEGYLVIPNYDIKYLINFFESNIPSMPEATEASVRIAGRDGDISLKTTYEPIPFNIVCYTDENLSPEEKLQEERKVNDFLNSIKNDTIDLGFEREEKFYNVKYSGALTITRYPKHIQFSIPLKSSNSYAKSIYKSIVVGESNTNDTVEFESDTIKEAGATFIIEGPATSPIISLNDYEMAYDSSILEGNKLVIDSSNSTIKMVTSLGAETNAMRYYNHQFPKIKKGINTLIVESGITNPEQVTIEWYDLKF